MKKTKILKISESAHNSLMKVLNRYEWMYKKGISGRAMGCLSGIDEKGTIQKVVLIKRTGGCSIMGGFTKANMSEATYKIAKKGFAVQIFIRVGKYIKKGSGGYYHAKQLNDYGLHMISVSKKNMREITGNNQYNSIKYKIVS